MPLFVLVSLLFSPNQAAQPDVAAHAKAVVGAAALPAGRLGATWTTLIGQAGAFKGCGSDVRIRRISDKQMVITPCEFERAKIDVQIAFNPEGRISGLALRPGAAPATPYVLPPYANPAVYTEQELTIGGPQWPLPATLTMRTVPSPLTNRP